MKTNSLADLRTAYAARATAPVLPLLLRLVDIHTQAKARGLKLALVSSLGSEYWAEWEVTAGASRVSLQTYGAHGRQNNKNWRDFERLLYTNVDDSTDASALAQAVAQGIDSLRRQVAEAETALVAAERAADATRAALLNSLPEV
jgi:hypothetical protein